MNHLAQFLFPKPSDWQTRKQFKTMIWVVFAALSVGCILAGLMLYAAYKK